MKNRALKDHLRAAVFAKRTRVVVLTGARQTGKTTLVRQAFPDLPYVSLDDPVLRPEYTRLTAAEWARRYPVAIVDEIQKAPSLIETIKAAHDADPDVRYLLLGSSQVLLLSKVRESLAGRVSLVELWPLTLPEMATNSWDEPVRTSLLVRWIASACPREGEILRFPDGSGVHARCREMMKDALDLGGMPAVHAPTLTDQERRDWLRDYHRTYLERDVADLAALRELEPFVIAQKVIFSLTGTQVNFSSLARTAAIAPATARRFMRYLELSYQVFLLPPYRRNERRRLCQMPKVHAVDLGVARSVLNRRGPPTGEEFESAVVSEILRQLSAAGVRFSAYHLRTYDGREVDLLIELPEGFVAFEIKLAARTGDRDARGLRDLEPFLDRPLLGAAVLSNEQIPRQLTGNILALPAAWVLAA